MEDPRGSGKDQIGVVAQKCGDGTVFGIRRREDDATSLCLDEMATQAAIAQKGQTTRTRGGHRREMINQGIGGTLQRDTELGR